MDEERFKTLFEHYLDNNLSANEVLEFQKAVQNIKYSTLLDELLEKAYTQPAYAQQDAGARQAAFSNLVTCIDREQKKRTVPYRWLTGIAASLFIVLSAGIFFLRHNYTKSASGIYANDISPGINKATLTLANGHKIILTDTLKGELATQSGVKVSKTKNGAIIYTAAASRTTPQEHPLFNMLSTTKHQQYRVVLPDGTQVWLDAASSLKYPTAFAGNERKVELSGEAYFEVTHNQAMPFKVKTATQEVEVLGTHFNIKSYADEQAAKTTLLEGSVRVIPLSGVIKILKPGQQAVNTASGLNINNVDTEEAVAWKNGYFMFNNEDLGSVMKKISRWYDVEVVYEDPNQAKQVFGGSISRFTNIAQVLEMLEKAGNVHFKIEGKKITVI